MVLELLSSARTAKIKGHGTSEIKNAVLMTNSPWNHAIHGDGDWSVAHKDGEVFSLDEWHRQNENSNQGQNQNPTASEYPEWLLEVDFSAAFESGPDNSASRMKEADGGPLVKPIPYHKTGATVGIFFDGIVAGYTVATWAKGYDASFVQVVPSVFRNIRWVWPFVVGTYEWYAYMRPAFLNDDQYAPAGVNAQTIASLRDIWNLYQGKALKLGFTGFNVYTAEAMQKHIDATLLESGKTQIEPVPKSIWQILWMQKFRVGDSGFGASDTFHGGPKNPDGTAAYLPLSHGFDSSALKLAYESGYRRTMIAYDWYSPGKPAFFAAHGYSDNHVRLAFWSPHPTQTKSDPNASLLTQSFTIPKPDNTKQTVKIVSYNSATDRYTVRDERTGSIFAVTSSQLTRNAALVYTIGAEEKSIERLFPNWTWRLEKGDYVGEHRFDVSTSFEKSLPHFPKAIPASSTIDALAHDVVPTNILQAPVYSIFGSYTALSEQNGIARATAITKTVLDNIVDINGSKYPSQSANRDRIPTATSFANLSWASGTLTSTNGQVHDFISGQQYVSILKIKEYLTQS